MRTKTDLSVDQIFFCKPIDAAIRWSGLTRHASKILKVLGALNFPNLSGFPHWPLLQLHAERILDGMANDVLPFEKAGFTCSDSALWDDHALTVRHGDLKAWMTRFYPDQKASFLFDVVERHLHSLFNPGFILVLLAECEALKLQRDKAKESLRAQHQMLSAKQEAKQAQERQAREPGPRSHATHLNIEARRRFRPGGHCNTLSAAREILLMVLSGDNRLLNRGPS